MARHEQRWTSYADWALVSAVDTGNGLQIAPGYTKGTASIEYKAEGWSSGMWRVLSVLGHREVATIYYLRFRTAATQAELATSQWSEYVDGVDSFGTITFDMCTWILNHVAWDAGPWIGLEITLVSS